MKKSFAIQLLVALTVAVALLPPASWVCLGQEQKKEDKPKLLKYVEKEDKAYKWEKVSKTGIIGGATAYELKLTSQVWQKITWKHTLYLVLPREMKKDPTHVFLLIVGSGGRRGELVLAGQIANQVKAPFAILHDIPNQPLFGKLYEDDLIAHTFLKYMETKDPTWPLLFPMTKGAVKAMDAIEEFLKKELKTEVKGFVTSGASKRGWTTWLTAAVDKRVKAIVPMVYDNLDLAAQMRHQKDTWGEFSAMIRPYTKRNIPQMLLSKDIHAKKLAAMVDPFTYRDRITVPKLILIGTNDKYWPLDAANLYYDKLKGEKYILYVPNAGHGLNASIFPTVVAFFKKARGKLKFPELTSSFVEIEKDIYVGVDSDMKPKALYAWTAKSQTKDFRKAKWERRGFDIVALDKVTGIVLATFKKPAKGYMAIFAEAVYEHNGLKYNLCTNVKIFPPAKEEGKKEKPDK